MGFVSQSGHVGFKTQAAKGTYEDPGAADPNDGVFVYTRSGAMGGNRELLIPDPEIGGTRDIPDAGLGPISFSGEYDFYARCESAAQLLYNALGAKAAPTGTVNTGFTHSITPAANVPWVSVEEKIGDGFETFKYTDCKVNTFHLEADANGYLMGTAGLVGLTQETTTATIPANKRIDTSPLVVGTNVLVEWGGVALPAKSFSLDINNNIEDDDFRLGSLFLGDLTEKRRELTMSVTIRPEDDDLWKTAMWGGPAASVPGGQSFKDDVVITIGTYEDIVGADPGTKYSMVFTVPFAILSPFAVSPSGDDVLEHDIEIRAVQNDPAQSIITADITNSYATVN